MNHTGAKKADKKTWGAIQVVSKGSIHVFSDKTGCQESKKQTIQSSLSPSK